MRHAPVLLLILASTGAAAADPPKTDCPAPQAETVHLYLKANGTDTPASKDDGACAAPGSATARGPMGGKDCTGPRGGHASGSSAVKPAGACVAPAAGDSARGPMGGKDCTGPRGRPDAASTASSRTEHAINSKGTGATGRSAAPCPASPASSTAPAK